MNNFVILIPSYNDWDSLNVLIPKIHNVIKDLNKNISIIIINDSSTIKKRLILSNKIIADSKSGYSGAGKNLKKKFKTQNIFKSISAYSVGSHRHTSEIDQELSKANKSLINVIFTPHLSPMFRGILSTIYVDLPKK